MILFVHAGICDASMWDGFDLPGAERHEIRGFGDTPLPPAGEVSDADDLEARLGDGPVSLVGASFGGQVCLEVAARRPELVTELVLLDARVPDHDWSEDVIAFAEEEDRLLEEGDLDAAADLNARFWAPSVAELVRPMQRRSFELQVSSAAEPVEPERIDLGAIRARTLVVVGDDDKADFRAIAARLARRDPRRRARDHAGCDAPAVARAAGGDRRACAGLSRALTSLPTPLLSQRHTQQHFAAGSAR